MANLIKIQDNSYRKIFAKLFQSGNLNFLFGSGASSPAIPLMGNIENEVQTLFEADQADEANLKLYEFLLGVQRPSISLIEEDGPFRYEGESNVEFERRRKVLLGTLQSYREFIDVLEKVLIERKTNLLPKQANIFTTNYDLFFEKASESFSTLIVNDGFSRTPNLRSESVFTTKSFFNSVYNNGNLYTYQVEIPCLNLIKLHGSFSWKKSEEKIFFKCEERFPVENEFDSEQIQEFNSQFALVLPRKNKFRETIMDRTYYDLLRIYSNELDKENTVLVVFGFSFSDEHIKDITLRALKNLTLKIVIFAFSSGDASHFVNIFNGYSNVDIVAPEAGAKNDFAALIGMMDSVMPVSEQEIL